MSGASGAGRGVDVAVVGSLNVDLRIQVEDPPRQGETVGGSGASESPGGKGLNQAVAAARLGLRVGMVGAVGDDAGGRALLGLLDAEGVQAWVRTTDAPTGRAVVLVDRTGDSTITVVPGANGLLGAAAVEQRGAELAAARAVLLQHEVPEQALLAAAESASSLLVLNPAPARPVADSLLARADVLVPNAAELAVLAGSGDVPADPAEALELVRSVTDRSVVVTLGAAGALVVPASGPPAVVPAPSVEVTDTTAAGDTFCAALVDGLLRGDDLLDASRWAVRVAAVTVTRPGAVASLPRRGEVASP